LAHFARIKNGIVDFVTVGRDDDESREDELAHDGWIYRRTSYNTRGGVHYTDGQPSADQSKAFRKNTRWKGIAAGVALSVTCVWAIVAAIWGLVTGGK
jgi:hypothetical protein